MYLEAAQIETQVLRQGDIVSQIQIIGAINLNGLLFQMDQQGRKTAWSVPKPPDFADAMLLSHSCEIDTANEIKITSIILAPIRDINKATSPDKIQEVINSNLINEETQMSYLKYFYIEPQPLLVYKNGAVVDFSKCFSLRNNCYESILAKKILQLQPDVANRMSLKLALYFSRRIPPANI